MKNRLLTVTLLVFSLYSCDNSKNVSKKQICDKIFKDDKFLESIGMTVTRTTILKCDGTFESGVSYSQFTEGELGTSDRLTGSWGIEEEIPENIKDAVRKYGLKHNIYSVIKYTSSNGISGYCLYYKEQAYYVLTPLYLNQIPLKNYEHSGSLGIWGGYL